MIKNCPNCKNDFETKDSRQKTCGAPSCANALRSEWTRKHKNKVIPLTVDSSRVVPLTVDNSRVIPLTTRELPNPEELPAPYAKRVHDMWAALTGEAPTRIA